jgi:hypothetical protein
MEGITKNIGAVKCLYRVRIPKGGAYYAAATNQQEAVNAIAGSHLATEDEVVADTSTYSVEYIDTVIV